MSGPSREAGSRKGREAGGNKSTDSRRDGTVDSVFGVCFAMGSRASGRQPSQMGRSLVAYGRAL